MKKLFITFLFSLALFSLNAQNSWTLDQVPNTRLQSNYIHVSDPDGYLSPAAEMKINTALCAIRDTVDVFLVCLNSIGYEEPKDFVSRLLNKWGVGDKGKDNGLMLLFVEDQHAFEFETGYGIEPVLTDVKCFEIFQHTIKPYFREGDYEGGMYAGVLDIVDVFGGTVPDDLVTVLPDEEVYKTALEERDKEIMSDFYFWFMLLFFLIPMISFFYFIMRSNDEKKRAKRGEDKIEDQYTRVEKDGRSFIYDPTNTWSGSAWVGRGCARAAVFGLSALIWYFVVYVIVFALMEGEEDIVMRNYIGVITIICYLSYVCFKQNRHVMKTAAAVAKDSLFPKKIYEKAKNYRRTKFFNFLAPWLGYFYKKKFDEIIAKCPEMRCPECGADMERDEEMQPTEMMACEEKLEVRNYVSARCQNGHIFVIANKGKEFSKYTDCEKCGAHTVKLTDTKVIEKATYDKTGLDEKTYVCQFCGNEFKKQVKTPKRERPTTTGGSYGGSSHSYGGSSHSSGGSFGGGRSGGGGYSGRW